MDHTLARKSVYRLVGSLVMAVIFLVGMATPVSALTIQATRGATITMKTGVMSSKMVTISTGFARGSVSGDEPGYGGGYSGYGPVNGQATSPPYRYGGRLNEQGYSGYGPVNGQATSPSYRYGGRFNEQGYGDTSCVSQCPAASEGPTLSAISHARVERLRQRLENLEREKLELAKQQAYMGTGLGVGTGIAGALGLAGVTVPPIIPLLGACVGTGLTGGIGFAECRKAQIEIEKHQLERMGIKP